MLRFILGVAAGAGLYHWCMQKETQEKMSEMYGCASEYLGKAQEKMKDMAEKGEKKLHEAADYADDAMNKK
ncbi:MAG: hypothetical protein LUF04_02235 [Bacteroides sp.]|nr:hypothetical protein [Bacteroides sp.]MCD8079255.1 hypothetical protein [Bacteroides sp.]